MTQAVAQREYTFRPAVRENIGMFIGLAGESGSGKTWSAMALATGIVGPGKRFAVIDTENKRARHYADAFAFDVFDLDAPFSSERYEHAVKAAYGAGYKAIVVDSATHEHEGEGGYLDAAHDALDQMVKRYMEKYSGTKEWEAREKLNPSSWIEPKRLRKRMMYTMLACSSTTPIIFCFRAEEQVFGTKDGKLVTYNPPRWRPICGKGMPFEMTVSLMMHADKPGYPVPIKLQEQHKALFPLDKPITEESGMKLAEWAKGGTVQRAQTTAQAEVGLSLAPGSVASGGVGRTDTLINQIHTALTRYGFAGDSAAQIKKRSDELEAVFGVRAWADVQALPPDLQREGLEKLQRRHESAA